MGNSKDPEKNKIFLSFDDGPSIFTEKILDILKEFKAKASFFVCGKNAERYPEIIKRIFKEGHLIGNHTFSHSFFYTLLGKLDQEIEKTEKAIKKITGFQTRFFRPPWGILNSKTKLYLEKKGYRIVLWDINSYDWTRFPLRFLEKMILFQIKPKSILLFHDGCETKQNCNRSKTIFLLLSLLSKLKGKNFKFENLQNLI